MKKLFLFFGMLLFTAFTYAQTNNVLLEVATGVTCVWCPCGHAIVNTILTNRPNTLVLEYHVNIPSADPFSTFPGSNVTSLLGFSSAPSAVVGRRTGAIDRTSWAGQVYSQGSNFPSPLTLNFTKTYNASTRQLTLNASALALRQIDTNVYISVVIYENNIIYSQAGNSSCTGGSNYVHKYLVRAMVNGDVGESLNTGTWASGTTKNASWNYTLPGNWVDTNCFFGVFTYFNSGSLSTNSYVLQTGKGSVTAPLTSIGNNGFETPDAYTLFQNYPNPFNPTTNIKFSIPKDGNASLKIYDVLGNEVSTYFDTYLKSGIYNVVFDGAGLSSGVYFYKLVAGNFSETKRMIITK